MPIPYRITGRLRRAALCCAIAVLAAACSGTVENNFSELNSSLAPTTTEPLNAEFSGEDVAPDGLAFAPGPRTLRISVPTLDFVAPYLVDETDTTEVFVTDLLTDGLTVRDPQTGGVVPGVASSWSSSQDGLVWTFTISDATFGDGSPIEAVDVVDSLNQVAALGIGSISGPNLWPIDGWIASGTQENVPVAGITAVDVNTVQIALTERFEELPAVLSGVAFGIWPADLGPLGAQDSERPMSSSVDFAPTAMWTDGIGLSLSEPIDGEVSTIELLVDPTNSMFAVGETDVTIRIDPTEELGEGFRGVAVERSAEAYYAMNMSVAPLDDALIRQAILHAIDRSAIRDEYFPEAGVMGGFVSERLDGGTADRCGERCEFDREQARLLVDASPNSDVPFTVDFFADPNAENDDEQRLAEAIVSQLRDIGLVATAREHEASDFGVRAAQGELGLFRFGSVSTVPSAEAELAMRFHTDGSDNLTSTSIDRVDELIEQARVSPDATNRTQLYTDAEVVLFNEAVVLPLVEFRHHLAHGPSLTSAGLEPDGSLDLGAIEFVSEG